jgi:hypothetical protein
MITINPLLTLTALCLISSSVEAGGVTSKLQVQVRLMLLELTAKLRRAISVVTI